jgi:hypothetical protein
MLLMVANDDVASFRNNNQWLINHPIEALIFKDLVNVWDQLKSIYNGDFRNLVYGDLPSVDLVLSTMKTIKKRLEQISWSVEL